MPVDFTKKEKTNYEYLEDILNGNEEALEFLEGYKQDNDRALELLNEEIEELEDEVKCKGKELLEIQEEAEYEDEIKTGNGPSESIRWSAPNLAHKTMMEELDSAIGRGIPVQKIENILRSL